MGLLRFFTALCGLFGRGRSPAMMLNLFVPRTGYRVERDIVCGPLLRNRLDLYLPLKIESGAPGMLFFYGGGFRAGRKSEYRIFGQALASAGMIVGIADYRIYPEAKFPNFLDDAAKAVVKFRSEIARAGGDPNRLFVAGHSAGAYIAVMLGANEAYLKAVGATRAWFRGVIGLAGLYGSRPLGDAVSRAIFGEDRDETKPMKFIRGDEPPVMLAVGAKDGVAQVKATRDLAETIRSRGGAVEEIQYPGLGHGGIILALAPRFRHRARLREDIIRFVRAH